MYLLIMLGTTRGLYLSPLGVQGSPKHSQGRFGVVLGSVVWCPAGEEGLKVAEMAEKPFPNVEL
jgi:hypothetical protein